MDDTEAVFAISVAAERSHMQIQNLRVYERRGLITPARTPGGTRLYTESDVRLLRRISTLLAGGLNLAGISRVLQLEAKVQRLEDLLAAERKLAGPGRGRRSRR